MKKFIYITVLIFCVLPLRAQEKEEQGSSEYKKRVLESTEVDLLSSYYSQDGDNAAVSGGIGTEKLTDFTPTIVVAIPLNDDDVLTIDAGVSAYTSASSSNINPWDGTSEADPFQASSGASSSDMWGNFTGTFSHSSDDRNSIWTAKISVSSEYDYFSVGFGGSYTKLLNEKNTELSGHLNVYLDTWNPIYPYELRPFAPGGSGLNDSFYQNHTITGNPDYQPVFDPFRDKGRNSYSAGITASQIFSKRSQGTLMFDIVRQDGLLSTPFQRVYFQDVEGSYIENFQLADAIEQLPDSRMKIAVGARYNQYLNEMFVLRTYYRYYFDDWGIRSHTASLEIPVKIASRFTLYPSYRYYSQTAADYFAPYEQHLSTDEYYTSDYDLSKFNANQFGFGINYTDIFTGFKFLHLGLKSFDLKYYHYKRNTGLTANIITGGFTFLLE
ncbi:DUF3570 domain-containing protein [Robertkochia solimangrovi]|uniref:DUF3570 domain-containing protein n=1 Tax=Robertkochia solimangrovi TaxID=2213046 RepID=UPI00117C7E49|nr:DUF3570 domain-containing protein [Robertkochia solimangrovi]TRZ43802.1 hypothetical protein DMZ48_09420 [Robertkochia solimangrovi]